MTSQSPVRGSGRGVRFTFDKTPRAKGISLTPLIDVVFILLLFFMLASRFDPLRATPLVTQADATAAAAAADTSLHLTVLPSGIRAGDSTVLSIDALAARVQTATEGEGSLSVRLSAGDGVEVQRIVDVLDRLRELNVQHIAIEP